MHHPLKTSLSIVVAHSPSRRDACKKIFLWKSPHWLQCPMRFCIIPTCENRTVAEHSTHNTITTTHANRRAAQPTRPSNGSGMSKFYWYNINGRWHPSNVRKGWIQYVLSPLTKVLADRVRVVFRGAQGPQDPVYCARRKFVYDP